MSTGTKRPHSMALRDAEAFRELFSGCYAEWAIAGSVRRGKSECADVEHVVIPKDEAIGMGGLFVETKLVNAAWRRLDALVRDRQVSPALYTDKNGAVSQRWGESYRGVLFNGFKHEIFMATPENFGAIFLIRTGPADYSRRVVDTIRTQGLYRQTEGRLIHVASGEIVPVPDEATYLRLAGLSWQEPKDRA